MAMKKYKNNTATDLKAKNFYRGWHDALRSLIFVALISY